jgi:hypothetical protein
MNEIIPDIHDHLNGKCILLLAKIENITFALLKSLSKDKI